jgi:hypothetical protein
MIPRLETGRLALRAFREEGLDAWFIARQVWLQRG